MTFNNKGITLPVLIITVILMLILSGVAVISGIEILEDAKLQEFTSNINQIESAIDSRWLKYQTDSSVSLPGTKVTSNSNLLPETLPTDPETSYYLLDSIAITNLGLSDLEADRYIVNYSTGEVIDTIGIEIDDTSYHTIDSLSSIL